MTPSICVQFNLDKAPGGRASAIMETQICDISYPGPDD